MWGNGGLKCPGKRSRGTEKKKIAIPRGHEQVIGDWGRQRGGIKEDVIGKKMAGIERLVATEGGTGKENWKKRPTGQLVTDLPKSKGKDEGGIDPGGEKKMGKAKFSRTTSKTEKHPKAFREGGLEGKKKSGKQTA